MHGWGGNADEFFSLEDEAAKNMLDHMIENGDLESIIVIAPTFDVDSIATVFSM